MRRAVLSVAVLSILTAGIASRAEAAVYTVTLSNGTTFETRYQPEKASWDADKIVLLTDQGNRISLASADVSSVTVDTETRGFGSQLNATTMALGWAPNDSLDPDSGEGQAALAAQAAADSAASGMPQIYNQQQFVEPAGLTGLPVWMTGVNAVPQVQPEVSAPVQQAPQNQ